MQQEEKKAVVLLSGGLDSTTILEIAKSMGYEVYALSFKYGQRHAIELDAVKKVTCRSPVREHKIVEIDLRLFGGSALTDSIPVPKSNAFKADSKEIPVTYVPARNTIFLSFALGYAEVIQSYDIFIGANAIDFSNYPDCRPEYFACYEKLAQLATSAGIQNKGRFKIHTPLLHMSKAEIIKTGLALGVDYSITTSCYDPNSEGHACGRCDSCHLRIRGFQANNMDDPVPYVKQRS